MRVVLPVLTIMLLAGTAALAYDRKDLDACHSDDADVSIPACTRLIDDPAAKAPTRAYALYERALAYEAERNLDALLADLNKAIEINPVFVDAWYTRGRIYQGMGEYDRSIADLTEAIRLDPELYVGYNRRGLSHFYKDEADLALKDFDEAVRLQGRAGRLDRAIADFSEAIRLQPDKPRAYVFRAQVYQEQREYDLAIGDYDKAIVLAAADSDLYQIAATPIATRATSTTPLRTTARPSASVQSGRSPTTSAASPIASRATANTPSKIFARRFVSRRWRPKNRWTSSLLSAPTHRRRSRRR